MQLPILQDIVITLGGAVLVALAFRKFKLPLILGFLIAGILAGPSGFSLIHAAGEVETMAEIGVILLLFIIGLEFSLKSLYRIKETVFLAGGLQVGITILLTAGITYLLNLNIKQAIFTGNLISLSSTAICLKLLSEQAAINSPHGKISLAILIFQDIAVIPMILFTPIIAGKTANVSLELLMLVGKGAFIVLFLFIFSRFIIPKLLFYTAKGKSNELFIHTIVIICFSVAWMTSAMGLSLALGAFIAGLIISESEYNHQATSIILPFREVFTSFFFISVGMLLNLSFVRDHILMVCILTLLVFLIKSTVSGGVAYLLGYPLRTCVLVGMLLFQVGEFAFILSEAGRRIHLIPNEVYQYFLSVSILTMALTPFIYRTAPALSLRIIGRKPDRKSLLDSAKITDTLNDHLVIIGFGVNGKNLALAAKDAGIQYISIELNAETVKEEKSKGEPIIYGDAVHGFILRHVKIQLARVVVIAISDPSATKRIIANIRDISKSVHIIVRTRFINEMAENYKIGANEVIPEEFETSIEIFTRVLHKYLIPENRITEFVRQVRSYNYSMFRPLHKINIESEAEFELPGVEIIAIEVQKNAKTITELPLHKANLTGKWGITVIAIKRNDKIIEEIGKNSIIKKNDILYIFGKHENLTSFSRELNN